MKHVGSNLGALLLFAVEASQQEAARPRAEAGLHYSWLHVNSAHLDDQRTGTGGVGLLPVQCQPRGERARLGTIRRRQPALSSESYAHS